jgi:capsular exopolysaccharide synthesis family protein
VAAAGPAEHGRLLQSDWVKAFTIVRKRWRLAGLSAAIVFGVIALVVLWMRPEYEPTTRLEIDPPGSEMFSMQAGPSSGGEMQYLETQAQNLQTDDLAMAVIQKLGLDRNPDFVPTRIARSVPDDALRRTAAENATLSTFRSRRKVVHDPNSHIITVSVSAHDPVLAANVTNALAEMFVDRTLRMKHDEITKSRTWLQSQLEDVRAKVEQSNRELADFQKQTGVIDVDEGRNTFGELMADLDKQESQLQSERIQLQSYIEKARKGETEALPQIRDNPVIQKLTQTLAELRSQLSQDLVIYGVNHPNTKKLQSQVDQLEKELANQRKAALDQLKITYDVDRAREKLMAGQKEQASKTIGRMAEYNALKKQAQAQAALYNSLLEKVETAGIASASQSSNIRIVDSARVLDRPTRPNHMHGLALGLFAGLFAGIVLAFAREHIDRPLRTPQDVRECTGIPSVSVIPQFSTSGLSKLATFLSLGYNGANGPAKFLLERPHSPESEAVRALDASIVLAHPEKCKAVLVTSSLPGEGKTTVAVNLAIALSRHARTCLVDADLRRPSVAATFGLCPCKGLGEVLHGSAALDEALMPMGDSPNLSILPAGDTSDREHLMIAMETANLMKDLRTRFEFIVVDAAPILPYADGRVLSTATDGIVFVTRSGNTPACAMVRSMELLHEVNSAPVVSIVLNAHDLAPRSYGYYT